MSKILSCICPEGEEGIDPRGKIQAFKSFIRSHYGIWARIFGPKKIEKCSIFFSLKIYF
jgi:hypothetical protein